ncbi:MAG: TIGR03862 family flavoprotein [Maritimibacter sp.]
MTDALVIGAGPAGLAAAEIMAEAGLSVCIAEQMPSAGRKFLMAGKSGLNLTKSESIEAFLAACVDLAPSVEAAVRAYGPKEVTAWAEGLGQEMFIGSTGRVFPRVMKASPLLRAWLLRLDKLGVTLNTRWHWTGWGANGEALFETPNGAQSISAKVVVLALGGASWPRLGATGDWFDMLSQVTPFKPANMGFEVDWSPHMTPHFGTPIKGARLLAGGLSSRGEFVISARGIEGGGIYEVSRAMREGAPLTVDLRPDVSLDALRKSLSASRGKTSLSNHLRKRAKMIPAQIALLNEFGRPLPHDLAPLIKALPIAHKGPRPIEEAISTAGGLRLDALDENLMFHTRPGLFAAGEMLDWEAPTGGYLITTCLATGVQAGRAAVDYALANSDIRM